METQSTRLRLVFEDRSVLNETQLSDGMNQSWLLIEPNKHRKISDVCNHLVHIFDLRRSCPNGILLYMDGFVLPPSESTQILKDKEILCVKRREMVMAEAIEGADAGNLLGYGEVNRKEPVNNGMLLLANEEFDKETGGYKSESEEEKIEDEPSPIATASKKRKTLTTSRSSKKKKRRSVKDGFEDEVVTEDNNINNDESCPTKVTKQNKESAETVLVDVVSPPKVKRKKKKKLGVVSGAEGEVVRDETCNIDDDKIISKKIKPNEETNKGDAEMSDKKVKSPPNAKRIEAVQDNVQGVEQGSTEPDEARKGPSRSARRKKAKRQWRRELAKISQKPDTHLEPEVSKSEEKESNGHQKGHDDMPVNKKLVEEEKRKCNGNGNGNRRDTELVACVVRPGHIRFEPLDEEGEDAKQIEVPNVGFEWNGITSKKKGQKWGLEKYTNPTRGDDYSQKDSKEEEEASPMPPIAEDTKEAIINDFDNLPLYTSPKEGDVIAYRLVELSSSWTPELSSYRVGKISHYDGDNIVVSAVPEYPVVLDKMDEEDGAGPDNNSLYTEDGTLEIKFEGLVDVRSVNSNAVSNGLTQTPTPTPTPTPQGDDHLMPCSNENGNIPKDPSPVVTRKKEAAWSEVMEALNAKKSQLLEANEEETNKNKGGGWNRWSYRALRGSALGPTMARLRSDNNI